MIDLELLASRRAQALSQAEMEWKAPLASPEFAAACASLSDGEIEQMFNLSHSAQHLKVLAESLAQAAESGEDAAFSLWKDKLAKSGLSPEEGMRAWCEAWQREKRFAACLDQFRKR